MSEENQEKKAIHIKPKSAHRNGDQKNTRHNSGGSPKKFNNNKFRKPTVSPEFEKLKQDETITELLLGSKTVFATNKLNYSQTQALEAALKEQDDPNCNWYKKSQSKNGWLAVSAFTEDGRQPTSVLSDAIKVFDEFANTDKDIFRINYGEAAITVDFAKLNLCSFEDGSIIYPYGILFFSDVSSNGQFGASVAVIRDRYAKIHNKGSILPITADNWDKAKLFGSFNHSGHFVIFYANEEIEKSPDVFSPVVTTIDIEVFANKDNNGITQTAIGRVSKNSICVEDMVEYLTKKVFSRHVRSTNSFAAERFLKDYIYSIGLNPNNYNLDVNDKSSTGNEDIDVKFKSNFGLNTAGKKRSDTSGKPKSATIKVEVDALNVKENIRDDVEGVPVDGETVDSGEADGENVVDDSSTDKLSEVATEDSNDNGTNVSEETENTTNEESVSEASN